jgi:hypothetical protein
MSCRTSERRQRSGATNVAVWDRRSFPVPRRHRYRRIASE